MLPQGRRKGEAAEDEGGGAGPGRALHAQACAGHPQGSSKDLKLTAGIDQQEIEYNIHPVDKQSGPHGSPGITGAAQNHSQNDARGAEEHG